MIKKAFLISLAVVLAISMGVVGCEPGNGNGEEVYEISFATTIPSVHPIAQAWVAWGDMIEEESGGRVEFSYNWAGSFAAYELWDAVGDGIVDIAPYFVGTSPGVAPLTEISRLPFLGFTSYEHGQYAWIKAYEDPIFLNEIEGTGERKYLFPWIPAGYQLHMLPDYGPVVEPADIAGLSIGAEGEILGLIEAAGGVAVPTPVTELFSNLDTGLIKGNILPFGTQDAFGGLPLTTHHTIFGDGGITLSPSVYIMNRAKWDSLPSDIQELIEDNLVSLRDQHFAIDEGVLASKIAWAEDQGHNFTYLDQAEIDAWAALVVPSQHDEWIDHWEGLGYPAQDAYDTLQAIIDEYSP